MLSKDASMEIGEVTDFLTPQAPSSPGPAGASQTHGDIAFAGQVMFGLTSHYYSQAIVLWKARGTDLVLKSPRLTLSVHALSQLSFSQSADVERLPGALLIKSET